MMASERRSSSWRQYRDQRMAEPGAEQAYEAARLAFSLGAKVRQLRETHGWSQTELARRSDMTQSAVARFEAGGTIPTLPVLYRLTRALGVRLDVSIEDAPSQAVVSSKAPAKSSRHGRGDRPTASTPTAPGEEVHRSGVAS
jgi:transcriptional regulator with XRE-family HTH domain